MNYLEAGCTHKQIVATLQYLKACRLARANGHRVAYTTDPSWLVDMAINRRAGWFDDPTSTRGSAMPVPVTQQTPYGRVIVRLGKYPKSAAGDYGYRTLQQIAYRLNSRVIVYETEVPVRYRGGLAHRLVSLEDF